MIATLEVATFTPGGAVRVNHQTVSLQRDESSRRCAGSHVVAAVRALCSGGLDRFRTGVVARRQTSKAPAGWAGALVDDWSVVESRQRMLRLASRATDAPVQRVAVATQPEAAVRALCALFVARCVPLARPTSRVSQDDQQPRGHAADSTHLDDVWHAPKQR